MNCRCGHGRGTHRKASGQVRLPCQATLRELVQDSLAPNRTAWVLSRCKCRDWVPPGGTFHGGNLPPAKPKGATR